MGLIGSGQEIHVGEEGGIVQWRKAIEDSAQSDSWIVHAPPPMKDIFDGAAIGLEWHKELNLDTEIRYHLTTEIHNYTEGLLAGAAPSDLSKIADHLRTGGFRLHITRSLDLAKNYAKSRYEENPNARYGLLASARDKDLPRFGVLNSWHDTKTMRVGPWYSDGEDSPHSCRKLEAVATEFSAQGLELDLVILCWGSDLLWTGQEWSTSKAKGFKRGSPVRDPYRLRINSYRVLLTRGRDGIVVYVPDEPLWNKTHKRLVACGFQPIAKSPEP